MAEEDVKMLVCLQIRPDTVHSALFGSIEGTCSICGHVVFVSRSGQTMIEVEPTSIIVCVECAIPGMNDDPAQEVQVVPGAFHEMAEHFANQPWNLS